MDSASSDRARRRRHRPRTGLSRRFAPRVVALVVLLAGAAGIVAWFVGRPDGNGRLSGLLDRADAAIAAKDYGAARASLEEYLDVRPGDARALYRLGVAKLGGGDEAGTDSVLEALVIRPDLPGARLFLARTFRDRGRLRESLEQAAAAPEAEAAALRARLLVRVGRLEDASGAFAEALSRDGRDLDVLFAALDVETRLAARSSGASDAHEARRRNLIVAGRRLVDAALARSPDDPRIRVRRARLAEEAGTLEPGEVEDLWREAVEADAAGTGARRGLAEFLLRRGREDDARAVLEAGVEAGVGADAGAKGRLLLADLLVRRGEAARAVDVAREAVARFPDDAAARAALVRALAAAGEAEDARRRLDEAVERFPADAGLLAAGGDVLAALGDAAGADDLRARALRLAPQDLELRRERIRPRIGRLLAAREAGGDPSADLDGTAELLEELLRRNPWDREGLRWSAEIARARGRGDLALSLLDELLRFHPDDVAGRALRGELLLARGAGAEAAAELLAVVGSADATRRDYELFVGAALPFGRFAEVAEAAERGVGRWPEAPILWRALGRSRRELGNPERFLRRLERAPGDVRADPGVRRQEAWALSESGRTGRAKDVFLALVAERPEYGRDFAGFLLESGEAEAAKEFLERSLADHPDSETARTDLAEYLLGRGDRARALALYEEALKRSPEDVAALSGMASLLAGPDGDPARARRLAERAQKLAPEDPSLLFRLGMALAATGDRDGARDALGRAVKAAPDAPWAEKALAALKKLR